MRVRSKFRSGYILRDVVEIIDGLSGTQTSRRTDEELYTELLFQALERGTCRRHRHAQFAGSISNASCVSNLYEQF